MYIGMYMYPYMRIYNIYVCMIKIAYFFQRYIYLLVVSHVFTSSCTFVFIYEYTYIPIYILYTRVCKDT